MAAITESRTWESWLSTTTDNYRGILSDNVFDVFPFLSWLNGKLGIALRGSTIKRMEEDGNRITEQLLLGKNTAAGSYAGAEQLDTTLQDGISQASYNWKQYSVPVGIEGLQQRTNRSEARIINLLEAKLKQAEESLRDVMNADAFSDGTGNSGKVMTGLQALVSATSTVGGVNPTSNPRWASTVTTGGSFTSQGLSDMRTTYNTVSFGNDRPDFIISTQAIFEFYEDNLQPQERYTNTKVANSGFDNLTFKSIPMVFDRDCPSGNMYMLNSSAMSLVVHPDADFMNSGFQSLLSTLGQDVTSSMIIWQGNITVNNRRKHAVINSITA